jgi:hypothetical protein
VLNGCNSRSQCALPPALTTVALVYLQMKEPSYVEELIVLPW